MIGGVLPAPDYQGKRPVGKNGIMAQTPQAI
jgi:hypothetical protein